jgi:geranylgeranyl reductase family protein
MRDKRYDAVIVGAGPIGSYLAQLLKREGIRSLLIEEHKELGRPVHCAGLVGRKVFEEISIPIPRDCILNVIDGAIIHLGKETIEIKRKNVAYVIDRELFDKRLGENLDIRFETRFIGLEQKNGAYIIETDKGDIETDIVIGADGAKSSVREFIVPNQGIYLKGVQFRMKQKARCKNMVEVYIKRPYFYWVIPESERILRVGVLSKKPYQDLVAFIKERKLKGKILEKFAGIVPLTHFESLAKGRVFLVGDSASQVKPLTYGGLYMGMRSAEILADCICKRKYSRYPSLWRKRLGGEITIALRAREIFHKLNESELRRIFLFAKEKVPLIENKGDFENHSTLAWEFLKEPVASKEIVNILLKIIKAGFRKY